MKYNYLKLRQLKGELSHLDIYFAEFMADLAKTGDPALINTFAQLSHAQANQHNCLDISGKVEIQRELRSLDCVTNGSVQNDINTPLVLWDDKLYLQRYFQYEANISHQLIKRNISIAGVNEFTEILDNLFPQGTDDESNTEQGQVIDWQKVAALQCLTRQLTIITGGPGTGKTSTVVKILAALKSQNPELMIKLAAPTGKAASRLNESIKTSLTTLPEALKHKVPTEVCTIHRLLGMRSDGRSYKYNLQNPISADLLILDEVSMIDLAMFDRILNALPPQTRLILLGDPGQLPSVDNGAVLTDLCNLDPGYDQAFATIIKSNLSIDLPRRQAKLHKLTNAFCRLTKSYRFASDTGIGALAHALREQKATAIDNNDAVMLIEEFTQDSLIRDIKAKYQPYLDLIQSQASADQLLDAFDRCRVLSPVRAGPYGVVELNAALEQLIQPDSLNPYYHGKPVIVTRNDYNLRLFNGDIGICFANSEGDIQVAFKGEDGVIDYYLASRLPSFETCFVMTVHKAQGSEFDQVSLVLPDDIAGSDEHINRELIYTAVTRARSQIDIYARPEHLSGYLQTSSSRLSGLTQRFLVDKPPSTTQKPKQLDLF